MKLNFTNCTDFRDWHAHWITIGIDNLIRAYEPDNTVIYEGKELNEACKALNNSSFGDLICGV